MGAYTPVSNVESHANLSLDVAEINGLLGEKPINWAAVKELYENGKNSKKSSGNRTLAGYARNEGRSEAIWDDYTAFYGDQTWLDTFVMSAIDGTDAFAGTSDAVRKQGAQKGIQNQIMISYTIHELVAAMAKAEDKNFDPASGAPHNWDEGWAFYHGVDPKNSPYGTAEKRGGNFGTGTAVNDAIAVAMTEGVEALVNKDAAGAQVALDEIVKQVQITYVQATIRYGSKVTSDLAKNDTEAARVHQAEGWAFFRVIEPMAAAVNASAASEIASLYDLTGSLDPEAGAKIKSAIEKIYPSWGISSNEIGELQ